MESYMIKALAYIITIIMIYDIPFLFIQLITVYFMEYTNIP